MAHPHVHAASTTPRRSFWRSCNARTLRYGTHASCFTLIVLVVVAVLYVVVVQHNQRFDLTRAKRFTLTSQSVKLLRNLTQPIKMLGFFRLEGAERGEFEELLKQYMHHTDKMTYELVDFDRQPALAQRYNVTSYDTIVVIGHNKEEKIFRLEEETLTNALLKVTRDSKKVVYFVTGHGEPSITESERTGYSLAKQGLEGQNYEVKDLLLARQQQVPDDAAVIVMAGSHTDLLEPELQALTAYLERGGHLLCMLDPGASPHLTPFLQRYGIALGNDVVIETNALGRLFGGDYHMPAITTYEPHPITRDFGGIMTIFPVVRSVRVADQLPPGVSVQTLISTSPESWAESDLKTLQEGRVTFDEGSDRKGPISIAVVATIPTRKTSSTPATTPLGTRGAGAHTARLVVIGDAEFATNNFFTLQGNGDLFLNIVSWLAEEEDLIALRPRREDGTRAPIILTVAQQRFTFWVAVVMLPVAVSLVGAVVMVRRRWRQ